METITKTLFDKTKIAGRTLANRLVVAPMTRESATEEGIPTQEMADYYAAFARGGFGMIITEGIYTDNLYSQSDKHQPGLVTGEQRSGWANVVNQVHNHDSLIVAQLMHAGALSDFLDSTVAPSSVQPVGLRASEDGTNRPFPVPKEMTLQDMLFLKEGFVNAAILARKAGFDGVEIHAANGYLFDQFVTEHTNERTDEYGGKVPGRLKFLMDVYHAIEEVSLPDFIVGIRLSESKVNDLSYRWPGGSETATEIFETLKQIKPAYFHIAAEGGNWARECLYTDGLSSTGLAKTLTGIPVIANGGMHDTKLSESLLNTDQADLISIGRAAIASPDWPNLVREGKDTIPFFKELIRPSLTLKHTKAVLEMHKLANREPIIC